MEVPETVWQAVYAVIREYPPRSGDDYGQAFENARVWRGVRAALRTLGYEVHNYGDEEADGQ